jgi:hypothetical protein
VRIVGRGSKIEQWKILLGGLLVILSLLVAPMGCSITPINLPLADGGSGGGRDLGTYKGWDGATNGVRDAAVPDHGGWPVEEASASGDVLTLSDGKRTDGVADGAPRVDSGTPGDTGPREQRSDTASELPVAKE